MGDCRWWWVGCDERERKRERERRDPQCLAQAGIEGGMRQRTTPPTSKPTMPNALTPLSSFFFSFSQHLLFVSLFFSFDLHLIRLFRRVCEIQSLRQRANCRSQRPFICSLLISSLLLLLAVSTIEHLSFFCILRSELVHCIALHLSPESLASLASRAL